MPQPKCEWCELPAQYDFVADTGDWRYGCTNHWMKNRASKQLGPGHANHIGKGQDPPPRPPGTVSEPLDPNKFVKPQHIPPPGYGPTGFPVTKVEGSGRAARAPREPGAPRVKAPKVFQDMPPGPKLGNLRPGSVMTATLDLIAAKQQAGEVGATMEEIQETIGSKHDALSLLRFMNSGKGYGFAMEGGRIKVVLPA